MGGSKKNSKGKGGKTPPSNDKNTNAGRNTRSSTKSKNIKFDELDFSSQQSSSKSPKRKRQRRSSENEEILAEKVSEGSQTSEGQHSFNNNAIIDLIKQINPKQIEQTNQAMLDLENGRRLAELSEEVVPIENNNKICSTAKTSEFVNTNNKSQK